MRGKILALSVAAALLSAVLLNAQAGGKKKGHACGMKGGMTCPMAVEGAESQVANTADGITITITAKDPEAVKKIQEAAAAHVSDGKFVCCCMGKQGKKGHKCGQGCGCDGKKGAKCGCGKGACSCKGGCACKGDCGCKDCQGKKDEKKAEEKK